MTLSDLQMDCWHQPENDQWREKVSEHVVAMRPTGSPPLWLGYWLGNGQAKSPRLEV